MNPQVKDGHFINDQQTNSRINLIAKYFPALKLVTWHYIENGHGK